MIRPHRRQAAEHPRRDGPGSGKNQDPSKGFGFPGTRSRAELNAIQIPRRRTRIFGSSMFELAISHRTPLGAKSFVMTVEGQRSRRLTGSKHGRASNYSLRAKKNCPILRGMGPCRGFCIAECANATPLFPIYLLGVGVAVGAGTAVGLGADAGGVAVQDL
jgi:hypothetical protein